MKRLLLRTAIVATAAVTVAAWGIAAPSGNSSPSVARAVARQAAPPLPADVKNRKRWVIGVKCDFPPFGYLDANGHNQGYDVQVARFFARYAFGKTNRVTFICVTTPSRIPALTSKRVDIIISTLTFTKARAQVIDYSLPYYGATGRPPVPNNASTHTLRGLSGKTFATARGSTSHAWLLHC